MPIDQSDPDHRNPRDSVPEPSLQPASVNPEDLRFGSSEIWWWNNGQWGSSGYAIPNDGGKPITGNETMNGVHEFIGAEMFSLMHRPDVKFTRPPNWKWLFDLNKMLTLGIKRLSDYAVSFTDDRLGDAQHSINTPQAYTIYPIPFFGRRIRNRDALRYAGQTLRLLSEIMQHSDNDYDDDITDFAASMIQQGLHRIQRDVGMKFLGHTREEVEVDGYTIPLDAFSEGTYQPSALFTQREMVEERMPAQWWPQANDLTPIAGIPAPLARQYAQRWPDVPAEFYGDGGAWESAYGGLSPDPGRGGSQGDGGASGSMISDPTS